MKHEEIKTAVRNYFTGCVLTLGSQVRYEMFASADSPLRTSWKGHGSILAIRLTAAYGIVVDLTDSMSVPVQMITEIIDTHNPVMTIRPRLHALSPQHAMHQAKTYLSNPIDIGTTFLYDKFASIVVAVTISSTGIQYLLECGTLVSQAGVQKFQVIQEPDYHRVWHVVRDTRKRMKIKKG